MLNTYKFCFVIIISLIFLFSGNIIAESEIGFDYRENGEKGPSKWGTLYPEWSLCNNGKMQSPIDILNKKVEKDTHPGDFIRNYKPSNATLNNRGHDIMLGWEGDAGSIEVNGTEYALHQTHWHAPSEHTIDGKSFAAELHMVHQTSDNKTFVVSILYKIGRPDNFLSSLEGHLKEIADRGEEKISVGIVDPRKIKISGNKYYQYVGSLTTPPCTENVVWTINQKVRTIAKEQIKLFQAAVHDDSDTNARHVQPSNDRVVYRTTFEKSHDSSDEF